MNISFYILDERKHYEDLSLWVAIMDFVDLSIDEIYHPQKDSGSTDSMGFDLDRIRQKYFRGTG